MNRPVEAKVPNWRIAAGRPASTVGGTLITLTAKVVVADIAGMPLSVATTVIVGEAGPVAGVNVTTPEAGSIVAPAADPGASE